MPLLNMHIPRGVYFTLPEGKAYLYDRYKESVMDLARRFRDKIAPEAEKSRVTVCLENTSFRGPECLGDIVDCLLEAPCFALTYDAGHDFADGGSAAGYYRARADRLRHMHLHDCDGGRDHLPLGSGGVDKPAMLAAARERRCSVVLEAKTPDGLRQSVQWLRERKYIP
jgi:sugar phosphate isomerase/epimerase